MGKVLGEMMFKLQQSLPKSRKMELNGTRPRVQVTKVYEWRGRVSWWRETDISRKS